MDGNTKWPGQFSVSENEIFKKNLFSIQARMIEGVRFKISFNA